MIEEESFSVGGSEIDDDANYSQNQTDEEYQFESSGKQRLADIKKSL